MKSMARNIQLKILIAVLFFALYFITYNPIMAQIKLETGLPGHSTVPTETALPSYIKYLFIFGLGMITILALTKMIIGGILYIAAAGNAAKVEDAKDTIFQALLGVGILLVSYLLLRTINPDLVNLTNPNLAPTKFQNTNTPSSPSPFSPIPVGTSCGPNSVAASGFVCVGGKWVRTSGETMEKYPTITLIK